jgi:PKD repeat protein
MIKVRIKQKQNGTTGDDYKKFICLLILCTICSCHKEQTIPVEIDVLLHVRDEIYTSPLLVGIENRSRGASNFLWTFEGGEPQTSTQKNPESVRFVAPGEHAIILEAWNDGFRTSKTYTVRVDSAVTVDFFVEADINNYAPASFLITNKSSGGSFYLWTFEGASPAAYEGYSPPAITYVEEGSYTISLETGNGSETYTVKKTVDVREPLDASFTIIPSFEDEDDMEAPLQASFATRLQGVESLVWKCEGAVITDPQSKDATIRFPSHGAYTVYLEVSNGKERKRVSGDITVKANTNLRTHRDIYLGINTAQENFNVYYSTKLRRGFKISEINEANGHAVDIVYFGLNSHFSYNLFVSPDQLSQTTFPDIAKARPTRFINRIESGNIQLTPDEFNNMDTDVLLRDLPIAPATYGDDFFTNEPLPRIVLFETSDGRKGAILIKKMISVGKEDSCIEIDIKIQKND